MGQDRLAYDLEVVSQQTPCVCIGAEMTSHKVRNSSRQYLVVRRARFVVEELDEKTGATFPE